MKHQLAVALLVALSACASSSSTGAIASRDASPSPTEAGLSSGDATPPLSDGGAADEPATNDASSVGPIDGGDDGDPLPPRSDVPQAECQDSVSDVYVTPPGLPPMSLAQRGSLVRCAKDASLAIADVNAALASKDVANVTPSTGTNLYRIAYRTYRDDGVPGVSTARVYLPQTPRSMPLPVVAIAHPTEGLAASCAPSKNATDLEDLALPWAAHGFAVIATDYAGLGNEGVQGYLDNHDQAHSVLDSARALRSLLDPRALDERVLLVGYSQGGGAVLAAQGLARTYGAGGNVVATIVFSAEYYSRPNSFQLVTMLGEPTALTISTGITEPVVASMRDYAFGYNVLGASSATATFPAGQQSGIQGALESLCQVPFGGYVQGVATHVGDIFDDGFRSSLLACIQGADAGCTGTGKQFHDWMTADLVAPDPAGAPVLYVQGLADTIMPPAQEGACNIGLLRSAGVPVQVCTDPAAEHTDVTARNAALVLAWGESTLYQGTPPSCSSAGMPTCQP